jgi:hypothetical protein
LLIRRSYQSRQLLVSLLVQLLLQRLGR